MATSLYPDDSPEKQAVARKTTRRSLGVNLVLSALQIAVGMIGHSQALIADGVHSVADAVSDIVVLFASQRGAARPDADHNYGHSRYETVASLFLGALLIAVGAGMLWRAGARLAAFSSQANLPAVHISALLIALLVLVGKEALFRVMLREAQRVRSALLIANAWHARSDAASSLVVALGIIGSLAGFRLFDPIAASIVGFMIARMGWVFGWNAMQDLSDRALDGGATTHIHDLLMATPGVRDVHELRTRKMGDLALVDAHILVDPLISVSEGHYIAETARLRLMQDARVLDALIHVDPENDAVLPPAANLPMRDEMLARVQREFAAQGVQVDGINLHYLSNGIELDVTVGEEQLEASGIDTEKMARKLGVRRVRLMSLVFQV